MEWLKDNLEEKIINENIVSLRFPFSEGVFENIQIVIKKYKYRDNEFNYFYEIGCVFSSIKIHTEEKKLPFAINCFINMMIAMEVPDLDKTRICRIAESQGLTVVNEY